MRIKAARYRSPSRGRLMKPSDPGARKRALPGHDLPLQEVCDSDEDEDYKSHALKEYEKDKHAATSATTRASLWRTWQEIIVEWHGPGTRCVPVLPRHIAVVGAMMKARGYRSFANYASRAKEEHVKSGHTWSELHELEVRQGTRSVLRGAGPSRQSAALRLEDLPTNLGGDEVSG